MEDVFVVVRLRVVGQFAELASLDDGLFEVHDSLESLAWVADNRKRKLLAQDVLSQRYISSRISFSDVPIHLFNRCSFRHLIALILAILAHLKLVLHLILLLICSCLQYN